MCLLVFNNYNHNNLLNWYANQYVKTFWWTNLNCYSLFLIINPKICLSVNTNQVAPTKWQPNTG